MVLMGYSGSRGTLIYEKNLKSKISCQTPFKNESEENHGRCTALPRAEFFLSNPRRIHSEEEDEEKEE